MTIDYNQQSNPNSDYSSLLDMLGRDREFINNHQQIEPSNRYKRMLQQELAYQAKENGVSDEKLAMLEDPKFNFTDPKINYAPNNNDLLNAYQKAITDAQIRGLTDNSDLALYQALAERNSALATSKQDYLNRILKGEPFLPNVSYTSLPDNNFMSQNYTSINNKAINDTLTNDKNENHKVRAMVFKGFLDNGFTPAQARAFTAEIGRENGFNPKILFGTHNDGGKTAYGMVSWQGKREHTYKQFMRQAGIPMDKNGNIPRTQEAINAQIAFIKYELQNDYRNVGTKFLSDKNISLDKSFELLGKQYFVWDMKNHRANGWRNVNNTYNALGKYMQ